MLFTFGKKVVSALGADVARTTNTARDNAASPIMIDIEAQPQLL
jgi:hypothetical protein